MATSSEKMEALKRAYGWSGFDLSRAICARQREQGGVRSVGMMVVVDTMFRELRDKELGRIRQ